MAVKPINFRAEDVQAILEGRKTHTCRPIKLKPHPYGQEWGAPWPRMGLWIFTGGFGLSAAVQIVKPPYQVGDELYVRETWCYKRDPITAELLLDQVWYRATDPDVMLLDDDGGYAFRKDGYAASPWKPSIHMPKWASRRTLVVTGVGAFRVQDITEAMALAEGMTIMSGCHQAIEEDPATGRLRLVGEPEPYTAKHHFLAYWDTIYKPPLDVASNPWVFGYWHEVKV